MTLCIYAAKVTFNNGILVAERAIFLATRLPLLGGLFIDAWMSQWLSNPEVERTPMAT